MGAGETGEGRRGGEDRDFKELAQAISGTCKSEMCREARRLETQGRVDVAVLLPKAIWKQNASFLKPTSGFFFS